jgi:hypothetical protein
VAFSYIRSEIRNSGMTVHVKRVALSMLGGVVFPLSYSIVAGPLSTLVDNSRLRLLLDIPVSWPRLIYFYSFVSLTPRSLVENDLAFLAYIVSCNVVLYTLMTYFGLLVISFNRVAVKESSPPLPPDDLGNN